MCAGTICWTERKPDFSFTVFLTLMHLGTWSYSVYFYIVYWLTQDFPLGLVTLQVLISFTVNCTGLCFMPDLTKKTRWNVTKESCNLRKNLENMCQSARIRHCSLNSVLDAISHGPRGPFSCEEGKPSPPSRPPNSHCSKSAFCDYFSFPGTLIAGWGGPGISITETVCFPAS